MDSQKQTICVIEDNEAIRKLFIILLRQRNYTVVDFSSGEEAMRWLLSNRPDIILCDIMLPDLQGSDVLQLVRTLPDGDTIRIIALTAHARQGDREKYLAQGFDGYIPKPINPQTFVEDIHAAMHG